MTFTENLGIYFPYTGGGATSGINDTGIETFNDDPIHSLVKETIQNSLDERSSNASEPVVVKFNLHEIDNNQFPYLDNLKNVLNSCKKYCIEYNNSDKKTLDIINKAINIISNDKISILEIADFNTTGLKDAEKEKGNFHNLVKSSGLSNKSDDKGGSFGIGKNAPFSCSDLRFVMYSSLDESDIQAFQGVTKWCTHIQDEQETQSVGYLGIKKEEDRRIKFLPFTNKSFEKSKFPGIDNLFVREEIGTSLFVMGFKYQEDWKREVIRETLKNYFVAIHENNLIVHVDNQPISKSNLSALINRYFDINDKSDSLVFDYYRTLTGNKEISLTLFEENDIKFYLNTEDNLPKKIAYVRSNGMKILDRQGLRIPDSFIGVLKFEGKEVNKFIKKLENPRHDNLSESRYGENESDRKFAKDKLKKLRDLIRNEVKSRSKSNNEETSNMFWLSSLFPNENNGTCDIKTSESIHKSITKIFSEQKTKVPKPRTVSNDGTTNNPGGHTGGASDNGGTTNNPGGSTGNNGSGSKKSKLKKIEFKNNRIFKSSKSDFYTAYIQSSSKCNTMLEIRIVGEDGKSEKAEISSIKDNSGKLYELNNINKFGPIQFKKDEVKTFEVQLKSNKDYSLEVLGNENNI
ncbi:MAG: hypothetical protein RSD77_09325 [Romboutsia sp.]